MRHHQPQGARSFPLHHSSLDSFTVVIIMLPDAATSLASSARNSMEVSQAAELHALHVLEAQRKRHAKRLKLSKLAFFRDAVRFKGSGE